MCKINVFDAEGVSMQWYYIVSMCVSVDFIFIAHTPSLDCTAGDDGSVGVISCMSIFSHVQGLLPRRQLAATRWSAQIPVRAHCFGCISQIKFCWKLPHFRSPDIFFSSNSKLKIFDTRNNSPTQFSERVKSETFY